MMMDTIISKTDDIETLCQKVEMLVDNTIMIYLNYWIKMYCLRQLIV